LRDRFDCIGEIDLIINSNLSLILKKLSKSKDPTQSHSSTPGSGHGETGSSRLVCFFLGRRNQDEGEAGTLICIRHSKAFWSWRWRLWDLLLALQAPTL
jgi:hypothetical protein